MMSETGCQSREERSIQIALSLVIAILLVSIITAATSAYYSANAIRTDQHGGATLAERYLLHGDWPSSNKNTTTAMEKTTLAIPEKDDDVKPTKSE
ncbi:hypothetical protein [Pontibacterium sp.]|uniref:hypothetical protein n=1 Tax=Pontibacterium sp. TaxID=2036026 RepID=UPI0035144DDA